MTDLFALKDKVFLITGGTRGVGQAISLHFARAGALVLANYVREQGAAADLLAVAAVEGLRIQCCRADISGETGTKLLLEFVSTHGPMLDGLIHCAATGIHRPLEQLTLRHFDWTYALNIRAFFTLVTQLLGRFSPGSAILAISSEGAVRACTQYTLVGSSKGALESMMRHFAAELAPKGIRVNALAPGTVVTDAWKALPEAEARLADAVRKTPIQRLVTLEEVAQVAHFLCSAASGGIIGQTIVVDGGARIVA